ALTIMSDLARRNLISVAALALLALLAAGSVDSPSESNKSSSSSTPRALRSATSSVSRESTPASSSRQLVHIGEVGVLRAGDSSGDVVVGADKATNDELTKMAVEQ